jgi:E3 ubiquitin-protein ligase ZSWIM2
MSQASQRLAPWRPKPGARVAEMLARAREASEASATNDADDDDARREPSMMLVARKGPTSFAVHERGGRAPFVLSLGAAQTCSCGGGLRVGARAAANTSRLLAEARRLAGGAPSSSSASTADAPEVCAHILFVMTKVLRVPRSNPIVWQVSLVDRELDEALRCERGVARRRRETTPTFAPNERQIVGAKSSAPSGDGRRAAKFPAPRPLDPDEPCSICYDPMRDEDVVAGSTVHCRDGCGRSVHGRCLNALEAHRSARGDGAALTCPMCRRAWGAFERPATTRGVTRGLTRGCLRRGLPRRTCGGCYDVIRGGVRFACVACESFDLCAPCFDAGTRHAAHAFERVDDAAASVGSGSAGVPVERPEGARRGGGDRVEEAARRRRRRRPAPGADANANWRGGGERASAEESDAAGLSLRGTSLGLSARRGEARRD